VEVDTPKHKILFNFKKMKNSKLYIGSLSLALVAVSIATAASTFAYQGNPEVQGPNYTAERHAEMTQAFEAENYEDWAALTVGQGQINEVVNADNFDQFVEAHDLALEGKFEEAQEIRAELGLGLGNGQGKSGRRGSGGRMGNGNGNCTM